MLTSVSYTDWIRIQLVLWIWIQAGKNRHKKKTREEISYFGCRRFSLDKCCGSRMFIPDPEYAFFSIPDPGFRVKKILDTGSASKHLSIFNPKTCFSALGKMIWDVHPVSGFFFYPGSRDQKQQRTPDPQPCFGGLYASSLAWKSFMQTYLDP